MILPILYSVFLSKCIQFWVLFIKYENIFSIFHQAVRLKKMIKDSQTQNPLRFLPKRKPKTHGVIRPLNSTCNIRITKQQRHATLAFLKSTGDIGASHLGPHLSHFPLLLCASICAFCRALDPYNQQGDMAIS